MVGRSELKYNLCYETKMKPSEPGLKVQKSTEKSTRDNLARQKIRYINKHLISVDLGIKTQFLSCNHKLLTYLEGAFEDALAQLHFHGKP